MGSCLCICGIENEFLIIGGLIARIASLVYGRVGDVGDPPDVDKGDVGLAGDGNPVVDCGHKARGLLRRDAEHVQRCRAEPNRIK